MKQNKPTHGGPRKGAGRPKTEEDTVVMRIPISLVERVKKIIEAYKKKKDTTKI